jgi:hypothetical protein
LSKAKAQQILSGLGKAHIIFCKREADFLLDLSTMLGNLFEPLIDRGVKILLTAFETYPGGDTVNINRFAFEMKPGPDDTLFYFPVTEFTHVISLFFHLSLPIFVSCDNQEHPRKQKTAHYSCSPPICGIACYFITGATRVTGKLPYDSTPKYNIFNILCDKVVLGHFFVRMRTYSISLLAYRPLDTL